MLGDCVNLGVGGSLVADDRGQTDLARVALEGTEEQGVCLAINITSCFCVGKGLVGNVLLETVQVGDGAGAVGGGSISEQRKDSVLNVLGVVQLQSRVGGLQDSLVGVLLCRCSLMHIPVIMNRSMYLRGTSRRTFPELDERTASGRAAATPKRATKTVLVSNFILTDS